MPRNNNNPETIDISDFLARPVIDAPAPAATDSFFEPDGDAEIVEENAHFDAAPDQAETADTVTETMPYDMMAEMVIGGIDSFQSLALTFWLEKKTFTKNELEIIASLTDGAITETALMDKMKRFDKKKNQIPFSPQEEKALVKAFAIYAKTINLKLTPFEALMISFGGVVAKRAQIMFT
jgi:hypothetical protein